MTRPFLAWPGWAHLRFAAILSAINAVWFVFIYGGSEWITAQRAIRYDIHLPIELQIPLLPGTVLVYMSLYALFLAGPFIVRERRAFVQLIVSLAFATLFGGIGFLLVPSRAAYPAPGDLGIWRGLFEFADRLNLDYNMVPSLHVAFAVCCVAFYARFATRPGRAAFWAWASAIALSTVFTHQHHLVDVLAGWMVGLLSDRLATAHIRNTSECRDFPRCRIRQDRNACVRPGTTASCESADTGLRVLPPHRLL